ncbi:hypothetical protein [Exiguobacterium sp. s193]|uniref:hypothetical protein n=1 Tax=Exiguobacterium sp. s193 TaxID=2751207 RepID=UPI001BE66C2E|nr:hypothetical protein [Exiguobacterium sp. s193]
MIGLTVLTESEGWLHQLEPTEAFIAFCQTHRFSFDHYDYNTHTFLDLLDYMDFQEFEHYLFILRGSGERTMRLVAYLQQKMLHVQFHLMNDKGDVLFGDPYFLNGITLPFEEPIAAYAPTALQDALMSLFTGVYPEVTSRHPQPLRHVYVEETSLLDSINPTLFDQMTINSVLYVDQTIRHDLPVIELMSRTPVLMAFSDTLALDIKTQLAVVSRSELEEAFATWHATSRVPNRERQIGILDYATLVGMTVSHRLFIFKDGICADYGQQICLSDMLGINVSKLREQQRQSFSPLASRQELALYPLLYQLAASFMTESQLVTPYSTLDLPRTLGKIGPLTMIGIHNREGCFVFELTTNQLFETDEAFLWILEADQKDRFDVLPDRLGGDYETAIQAYKELIYHG